MKHGNEIKIIVAIVIVAVGIILYSIYKYFVPMYFGFTLASMVILFSVALILMIKIAKDTFINLDELSETLENWIKNEDIRRDIEVLPFFLEERRKEYIKGLEKGYSDVDKLYSLLNDIKEKIEFLTDQIVFDKDFERYKDEIQNLTKALNIAITNLKLKNRRKKISYDVLRLRFR